MDRAVFKTHGSRGKVFSRQPAAKKRARDTLTLSPAGVSTSVVITIS
jgi:hypothetical protein